MLLNKLAIIFIVIRHFFCIFLFESKFYWRLFFFLKSVVLIFFWLFKKFNKGLCKAIHPLIENPYKYNNKFGDIKCLTGVVFFSNFSIEKNSWRPKKFKSHPHQIIPFYKPKKLYVEKESFISRLIFKIDAQFSYLPPYFSLVVSIASLFMLFFVFLHKKMILVPPHSVDLLQSLLIHDFLDMFLVYYASLIFYIVILIHSLFKLLMHMFDEIRCKYIYTIQVESQYLLGVSLFIASEAMLFFSFFWAFLHSSLAPSIYVGNCWPPLGVTTLNPWHIPFLNTVILLTSGVTVNWFFFTLKRFSYITYRPIKPAGRYESISTRFITYSIFNFYFINAQYNFIYKKISKSKSGILFLLLTNFKMFMLILLYLNIIVYVYSLHIFNKYMCSMTNNAISEILVVNSYIFKKLNLFFFKKLFNSFYRVNIKLLLFLNFFNLRIKNELIFKYIQFLNSFVDTFYFDKFYVYRSMWNVYIALFVTIYLGLLFLGFQYVEYKYYALFNIMNIYGTVFFLLTSLHGLHVYIGLLSLTICYSYYRSFKWRKSDLNRGVLINFLIIFSVWYWHFVDVVWLLLFIIVYLWGS